MALLLVSCYRSTAVFLCYVVCVLLLGFTDDRNLSKVWGWKMLVVVSSFNDICPRRLTRGRTVLITSRCGENLGGQEVIEVIMVTGRYVAVCSTYNIESCWCISVY